MTDPNGLGEAILLRLIDRLVAVEQQAAINAAAMRAMSDTVADLRKAIDALGGDLDALRTLSTDTVRTFEKMRPPLQDLLDLKARLSDVWLVVTGLLMVVAWLAQPVIADMYHRHLGG